MIVVGFPGIGKSTLCTHSFRRLDLESSNFKHDDQRHDDWYIYYCQIALDLSKQGYTVFVSSHKQVRDYLLKVTSEPIFLIYPSLALKDAWIRKLEVRYNASWSDKDRDAWKNAKTSYEANVADMSSDRYLSSPYFKLTQIDDICYSLEDIVAEAEQYVQECKSL